MPVRNIWSLEPGECIVAEEIMDKLKCEVYFPVRDVGLDLLVVKGDKHAGIQVKESRYYMSRRWRSGHVGHSCIKSRERNSLKKGARLIFTFSSLTYHLSENIR